MPLIHLELIFFFCASWELRIQFHSFTRGYPFSSALFVKEAVFPLWIFLASLSKIRRLYLPEFGSGSVALFHWFICLVLCQYRAVSVIMAMKYNLKSGIRWAGQSYQLGFFVLFCFFRIAFTIQGFFFISKWILRPFFFVSVKNDVGIFMGIPLRMWTVCGITDISTALIPSNDMHWRFFFLSASIFFSFSLSILNFPF